LVQVLDAHLRGKVFFLAHLPGHPRRAVIHLFCAWLRSVSSTRSASTSPSLAMVATATVHPQRQELKGPA
jgi:hypothetical protein